VSGESTSERAFQEKESKKEEMGTQGGEMGIPLLEEQEEAVPDRITHMLVLSAFFAVCGSYVFGNAVRTLLILKLGY